MRSKLSAEKVTKQLWKLKKQLEEAQSELDSLSGELTAFQKQMKRQYGVSSLEDLETLKKEYEDKQAAAEKTAGGLLQQLEDEYDVDLDNL